MSEKLKVGIVGSQFAARFHFDAYKALGEVDAEVLGTYSATEANREAFASERGIKAFSSFKDMLKEVDVVDVCTPGCFHELYAVESAKAGKHVIVEKPFTGYYGPEGADESWRGDTHPKSEMLDEALQSIERISTAVKDAGVILGYAENWVYAPAIQKEAQIIRKSGGQILWMMGQESHSGSVSADYGIWRRAGGGSLVGKGCHPLSGALYLKRVEGLSRNGKAIRPASVSGRMHKITRSDAFEDKGFLRTDYHDIEDYCQIHVIFEDGFVADIFSTELVLGGVYNCLEVFANNHRTQCNINPNNACVLYNPKEEQMKDVYLSEKLGTKQGWSFPSPDEDWMTGYPQETADFVTAMKQGREPESGLELAADTVATMYAAYVSDEDEGKDTIIPIS
jgi:predicted dehydrogenase